MVIKKAMLQKYMHGMFWIFYTTTLLQPMDEVRDSTNQLEAQRKAQEAEKAEKEKQDAIRERNRRMRAFEIDENVGRSEKKAERPEDKRAGARSEGDRVPLLEINPGTHGELGAERSESAAKKQRLDDRKVEQARDVLRKFIEDPVNRDVLKRLSLAKPLELLGKEDLTTKDLGDFINDPLFNRVWELDARDVTVLDRFQSQMREYRAVLSGAIGDSTTPAIKDLNNQLDSLVRDARQGKDIKAEDAKKVTDAAKAAIKSAESRVDDDSYNSSFKARMILNFILIAIVLFIILMIASHAKKHNEARTT